MLPGTLFDLQRPGNGARLSFFVAWVAAVLAGPVAAASEGAPPEARSRDALAAAKLAGVSGTVTRADTGRGVAGVRVWLRHLNGGLALSTVTGADGTYSGEVRPGTYLVEVFGTPDLIGGRFDGVACPVGCDPTIGTPVAVRGDVTGIDFAMKPGGRLSGRVTDGASGEPLPDAVVQIFDHTGLVFGGASNDEDGGFLFRGLPTGTYYLSTHSQFTLDEGAFHLDGYLDHLYGGAPCPLGLCNPLSGTPVEVRAGEETAGVDLVRTRGGTISGTVRDERNGDPLAGASIEVRADFRDAQRIVVALGKSDAEGHYAASGLAAGDYLVVLRGTPSYPAELYDGVACPPFSCDDSLGAPVSVAVDAETAGVDFAVTPVTGQGSFSGRVTDKASGQGLAGVRLHVRFPRGAGFVTAGSGAGGAYRVDGVPAGDVSVVTSNTLGYLDESRSPVAVEEGVETEGVDFALVKGGTVSGTVTGDAGLPLRHAEVSVYDQEGAYAGGGQTQADGRFEVGPYSAGTYFVVASAQAERFGEIFDGIPCFLSYCDATRGRPVEVELGVETEGVDFVLDPGLTLSGRVVDAATGKGLAFSFDVYAFDGQGRLVASSFPRGPRYTLPGLIPGTYFVGVTNRGGLVDELYGGAECPSMGCDVTSGTPVEVGLGGETPSVDFVLDRGGAISGTMTELSTGLPIRAGVGIEVYDAAGKRAAFEPSADFSGRYRISGLPGGTYFVSTSSRFAVVPDVLYAGVPCVLGCDVTAGTPVDVRTGRDTAGVDVAVALGGRFSGTITSRETGEVVREARVEVFLDDGSPAFSTVLGGDAAPRQLVAREDAYLVGALPADTYFVRVSADGFAPALYDGVPCPGACDVTAGTPVTIRVNEETSGIDFVLDPEE